MNKEEFINAVKELNINITDREINLLEKYYQELISYNSHTNLTAIIEEGDVYLKHFYDSLTIQKVVDLNNCTSLLDIGSGAGFPGIVLKIFFPHLNVTLIDSNRKKTTFLENIIQILNLNEINVVNDRVENYSKRNLNTFDIVTARAVTNLPVLSELALPLVKIEKYFIAMKGNSPDEITNSLYAISQMGGRIIEIQEFDLPKRAGRRSIIKILKKRNSNIKEIRSYDKIIKKPLQKRFK